MVKKIKISIPLKHPEDMYTFTYDPDFPGPFTIEITSSPLQVHHMLLNNDEDITMVAKKEPSLAVIPLHLPTKKEESPPAILSRAGAPMRKRPWKDSKSYISLCINHKKNFKPYRCNGR